MCYDPQLGDRLFGALGEPTVLDEYGDRWALITGASSGIGAAFARKLSALGMHLVLTARREDLMRELADELDTRHGTRTEVIVADLSEGDAPGKLVEEIERRGIDIELLVNNAGFAIVGDQEHTDIDRVQAMLQLNVAAVTELTHRLLRPMLQRGHGAVINVSSVTGFQPVAYMGAYAASKAFVLHFSEALWSEVRDQGVTVMALCPGATRTSFFEVAGVPGWLKKRSCQDPDRVVRGALKGLEKGRQFWVSGWKNYLRSLVVRLATRRTVVNESRKYFRPPVVKNPKQD